MSPVLYGLHVGLRIAANGSVTRAFFGLRNRRSTLAAAVDPCVPHAGRSFSHETPAASSSSVMWRRTPREACALNWSSRPSH